MNFAATDITFPKLNHSTALKLIKLLDFNSVSIGLFEGRTHIYPSQFFKEARLRSELSHILQGEGLALIDLFLQCHVDFKTYAINHTEKLRRDFAMESFRQLLDAAAELKCPHVTILPGVVFDGAYDASLDRCKEQLAARCELARKMGITVAVEPHFGSVMEKPEAVLSVVRDVPDLRLALDYAHFVRAGMDQEQVHPLCRYASLLHARCANNHEQQTIFSQNQIDYPAVVRELMLTAFKGNIVMEFYWDEWDNGNRVDNISETILLRNYLSQLIAQERL